MPNTSPHEANDDTPGFTPVPVRTRDDGWTVDRQRRFIQQLAATGNVSQAAMSVGMTRESASRLRARPDAISFSEAWRLALTMASRVLAESCLARAIEGTSVPIFYRGEQVGSRTVHSDGLAMFMLRALDPFRYGNMPHNCEKQYFAEDVPHGAALKFPQVVGSIATDQPVTYLEDHKTL